MQSSHELSIGENDVTVSDAATQKMKELLEEVEEGVVAIRVYVAGGGCTGMNYGMTFTEEVHERDSQLRGDDYRMVIDPIALSFLKGAEIDYVDDGVSATFVFNNVFQAVGGSGGCQGCSAAR